MSFEEIFDQVQNLEFDNVIVYTYDNGYCDKEFAKEELENVIEFLVVANEVLSISTDENSLLIEVKKNNFER